MELDQWFSKSHEIHNILNSKVLANILEPFIRDMAHKNLHIRKTSIFSKSFWIAKQKQKKQKKTNSLPVCNADDEHEMPHHALILNIGILVKASHTFYLQLDV